MGRAEPEASYGRRLMIDIIDGVAASDPERHFLYVPRSGDPKDGWKPVTYKQISRAVDHVAWQIAKAPRPETEEAFPTLAYIGANDVRYVVVMLACIKAGYKAFFISTRNTTEAQLSLFEATDCRLLWHTGAFRESVQAWTGNGKRSTFEVPGAAVWLDSAAEPFPYSRDFEEGRWDPAVVLHTSGSTGIPKPIVVRQGSFAVTDGFRDLVGPRGERFFFQAYADAASKIFSPMPLFHAAAIVVGIGMAVFYERPVVLGIPDRPLSSDLVMDCLHHSGAGGCVLPPSLMAELSLSEEGVAALARLGFAAFGGGNLAKEAGDRLVEGGVAVSNLIGSTESFPYPLYVHRDPRLWQYFMFDSKVMGAEWRPATGEPNVFELVVRRQSPRDPANQAVFYTFPELSEWSTKDLYSPHPTLPDHWLYRGRADTVIVFSNGEKLNPVTLEDIIVGHPAVKAALVVGQDKFQPALVLEPFSPCEDDAAAEALINEVWPTVEKANAHTVAHGRLVRWLVMVTQPDKPLPRAPKGTVQRAAAAKLYKAEIEELYARAQAGNQHEAVALQLESEEALAQSIVDLFAGKLKVRDLAMDTDFFSAGVDSLQVMSATSLLRHGLEAAGIHVGQEVLAQRVIYQNPTPRQLALHLFPAIRQDKGVPTGSDGERQVKLMKDLLSRYTQNLPPPRPNKPQALDEGQTVLLTGTTGSLGAYMLDRLCSTDSVKKVIALNRGQDGGRSRQPAINSFRNLTTDFSKVEFLGVDLSEPDLGLGQAKYDELLASADRIIHNAWPVNFNISVASFEPHIRGVRHLVDFAAGAAKAVVLVFVSSIGELDGWPSARGPVPEQRLEELTAAQMGYGRSKLVGSLLVDTAARQSGIPAASVRVGQIAGPKQKAGVWNPQEFLPSLIASSVHLGILPSTLGPFQVVDWIPVEDVAELILDVTGVTVPVQPSEVSGYFHAVNPATTQWSELAVAVKDYYGDRIKKLVSLEEFVARLEESGTKGTDVNKNPGVKLLDTYRNFLAAEQAGHGHVFFETTKTKARSPTARHLSKVTPELMKNWCQQWGF